MQNQSTSGSRRIFVGATIVFLTLGCWKTPVKEVVPTEGTLTIDGAAAANVMVRFVPDGDDLEGNLESSGVTDEQGHFHLVATDGRDGAIPGSGRILLVDLNEERPAQGEEATVEPRFPSSLGILNGQSLTATVSSGTPINVQLPPQ